MIAVYQKHHVILTAVGVYSINNQDTEVTKLRKEITERVLVREFAKQVHGFYYNKAEKAVRFDVVISFDATSRQAVLEEIKKELSQTYPEFSFSIAMDMDYGEI